MNVGLLAASADSYTSSIYGRTDIPALPSTRVHVGVRVPPVQAHLLGEIPGDLIVVRPLLINIELDADASYVVSDDLFLVYGAGDDQANAIHDYVISLGEFYRLVEAASANNPLDRQQLEILQTYIQPKSSRGHDAVQANSY